MARLGSPPALRGCSAPCGGARSPRSSLSPACSRTSFAATRRRRAHLLLPLLALLVGQLTSPQLSHAQPAPSPAPITPAPIEAALLIAPPAQLSAIAARLTGHRFRQGDHVLLLEDLAGQGRPWIGLVTARCGALWLETSLGPLLLAGPLARPRLAGPGYLVWATGHVSPSTSATSSISSAAPSPPAAPSARPAPPRTLTLARLGVLARPDELPPTFPRPAAAPCSDSRPPR